MGAGELQKDVWHREAETIARRNGIQLRRWGMRVTVYNDSDPANNGEWVLSYDLASTNRKDNDNWLKVADIGATWDGGGNTFKLPLYDDGGVVQLGTPPDMPFTDPINIEGIANFNINLKSNEPFTVSSEDDESNFGLLAVYPDWIDMSGLGTAGGMSTLRLSSTEGVALSSINSSFQSSRVELLPDLLSIQANRDIEIISSDVDASVRINGYNAELSSSNTLNIFTSGEIDIREKLNNNNLFVRHSQTGFNINEGDLLMDLADGYWYVNLADPNYSGNSILFSVVDPDGNLNEFYQDAYASYFRAFDGVSQESGFDYDATFARILSDGEIILTGDGEIFFFMNYLMGSGTEMLVIDKTTGRIDSQPIPGGGYTFQNGITNTSGTVRWGGQLTGNTFVYSDGSARDVFFGYNPSFNEFPIGTFYVGATSSIQFNIGSTAAPQSFGFTGTGNFSFTSRTANTNSSNTQFMERRIISNGTPENNFGGREVVALEVASGASVGAVMHEYRLLDASGGGRFQWNVCKTYIGTTIPNTSVIQSFNTTDRTVSFFTKDDDFGGGTETLKIANTTLAPSTPVADSIMVYADDTSDNLSSIALYTEQSTEVIGATTPTHKLKVKINGTEYFLLLATV